MSPFTFFWVLPNTILGFLLGFNSLFSSKRVRVVGPFPNHFELDNPWFLKLTPFPAMTFGHCVLCKSKKEALEWRKHELVHIKQYERLGPFFLPLYLASSCIALLGGYSPYYDNIFEIDAYNKSLEPKQVEGYKR